MRLLSCHGKNFGSYASLDLTFDGGLTLIQGATGSGKSTLMDLPVWTLFGTTAKGVAADEVKRWAAGAPTESVLFLEKDGVTFSVVRKRGSGSNDLFWEEGDDSVQHRGKDLTDTQRLLEERLGLSADTYIAGAYYHEFSPTGAFFVSDAKRRRALFEQIANMNFPAKIAEKASENRKALKDDLKKLQLVIAQTEGKYHQVQHQITQATRSAEAWERTQKATIAGLERIAKDFEKDKTEKLVALANQSNEWISATKKRADSLSGSADEIERKLDLAKKYTAKLEELKAAMLLTPVCPTCGTPTPDKALQKEFSDTATLLSGLPNKSAHDAALQSLAMVKELVNPYLERIANVKASVNNASERIEEERRRENTHLEVLKQLEVDRAKLLQDQKAAAEKEAKLIYSITCAGLLYDLSFELRSVLLRNTVAEIQQSTNDTLERHFDAELRVELSVVGGDALDVTIIKSGNPCSYKQLSKGQRGLLKLAFSTAVMEAVSNRSGVTFDNLFFDESLDGLDPELKTKAFALFEELSKDRQSVMIIDHAPELQNLFSRKYLTRLSGDISVLEDASE